MSYILIFEYIHFYYLCKDRQLYKWLLIFSIDFMYMCVWCVCVYKYIYTPEVALDFKMFRHFDGQGRKNSVIIYYYQSF